MSVELDGLLALMRIEVFSYVDASTNKTWHFNVSGLLDLCQDPEYEGFKYCVYITEDMIDCIRNERGIDFEYVKTIDVLSKPTAPAIGLLWPDGYHLLVDGHHRVYARYLRGLGNVDTFIFPEEIWKHYVISQEVLDAVCRLAIRVG